MFSMKKPAIITILVFLLVLVGYINHQLTQNSLLKSSSEYQKHEEKEMEEGLKIKDKDSIEAISEDNKNELSIIDSKNNISSKNKDIKNMSKEVNTQIDKTINKEENIKSTNYFIEHKLARDKLRGSLIEQLQDIVDNEKTSDEMRKQAQSEIIKIGSISETELYIEGLIKAKGFEDTLVFLKEDDAKVVVSANKLTEQDVAKILDIVKNETGLETSQIKIMKKH